MQNIKEIYKYREMIFSLVRRDLKGRYKGSVLGFAWTFLNPLLQLGVYTLVFSVIMKNGIEDYYLYLFVALVPWLFFSSSVSAGSGCIRAQQDMIKKIYFPREVVPISFVTSQFVNMLLSLLVVFAVIIFSGKGINFVALLYLPLIMVIEYLLALGTLFVVAGLTVYLRDLEYLMGIITMSWQFLTPVMYGLDQVPEDIRFIFNLNPMTSVIVAYRQIMYYKEVPDVTTLTQAVITGIILIIIGYFIFGHLQKKFAEEL